ncbi:DUF551 domain-containing protein [Klebsiella pneumoniae]
MTKSTITRERLEQLANFKGAPVTRQEEQELARMALAAMDSEPDCNERQLFCSTDTARMKKVISVSAGSEATPLYRHAQPAPVVSAELLHTAASAIEDLLTTKDRTGACVWFDLPFRLRSAANEQTAPVVDADDNFYSWFGREWAENYQHNQYTTAAKQMLGVMAESAWKAGRRAAMLAAAPQSPGSEPATVPGKWIPVSERMPIEFEAVIAFDGDQVYGEAMYSSDDGFTIDGYEPCDRLNLQNVTHWMPLPAGPQEVK